MADQPGATIPRIEDYRDYLHLLARLQLHPRLRGRAEIVDYLRGLFADDNFNRGETEGPPETSFRALTPEVVLVSAHLRIKGQGLVGGGTLDRDNFSLRALQRQADGSWLIVSEMFQDANTETTYAQ